MTWLHSDHLGSASLATDASGAKVDGSDQRYKPFGEKRFLNSTQPSRFGYTGQRDFADFGMMDYGARMYSPLLGRFLSADTIVQDVRDPQALNRYAYTRNNPLKYVDPSGHCFVLAGLDALACWGVATLALATYAYWTTTPEFQRAQRDAQQAMYSLMNGSTESEIPEPAKPNQIGQEGETGSPTGPGDLDPDGKEFVKKNWGDKDTLDSHYTRHGKDVGSSSKKDYVEKSQEFFKNANKPGVKVKVVRNEWGEVTETRIWDPKTQRFGSYNPDGTTRTYFKPNLKFIQAEDPKIKTLDQWWNEQRGGL